ncbi:BTAD domain-containing putative transcriptional regulator [Modestobacter sp. I12A-02662]|uniref:AfsR/SARP family transcriptional regulator n=1 Tax=Modestobacter sp. I12A-02662 TaxID=1730496 RepID=UPI0034DEC42F
MSLLVLGPLEVAHAGRSHPVRRGRPRRLLLALLVRRGDAVPRDVLIDQLWGDEPPVNADNALHLLISYLRRALADTDVKVDRTPSGYRLVVPRDGVDMFRFEDLARAATAASMNAAQQLRFAAEALALWRGPALSEAADDAFAQGEITRLDELRLQAHEARAAGLLALGRHDEALADLAQLVREHPFRERLHGQFALALYRSGRQADALRALEATRAALVDELGLDPSPALQTLERQILRQDPALDPPPAAEPDPVADVAPPGIPAAPSGSPELPVPLTPLIGREEEAAGVRRLLAGHRMVTVTGPGGVGKTRLAVEAVQGRDGVVWWADLATVARGPGVGMALATAAGTGLATGDAVSELRRWIGSREVLLVLDTCEHVAEDLNGLLAPLLAGCRGLRVLATSRRPLGVPGEMTWPVPPLALPDAMRLFHERAAAVRPALVLDEGTARDVATVCRLLDGLPLAIELAAAHAAALSPAKIAGVLGDRMRLLGGGSGTPARHAGLRAAVEWSYDLLADEEAVFLNRLSVFAGPFSLEAGVEVAGAGLRTDGLRLLVGLVRQSLVSPTDDDHFRLLDTIRAYAADRLATQPDEVRAAGDRHARWYAAFAEEADRNIRGADQAGWFAELRTASADLRTALRHCLDGPPPRPTLGAQLVCSLSWFWSYEGSFAEARRWIAEARAAGTHGARIDASLHLATGMHAESMGELGTAEEECRRAAAGFAAIDDVRGEARSLLHLGTATWALGRLDEAADAQDRAVTLFRSVAHDSGTGLGLVLRARTALDHGETELAGQLLVDARHVLRRVGDQHLVGLCLEQLARTHLAAGHPTEAAAPARESLEIFESAGYPEGVTAALQTLGQVHLAGGDPVTALSLYRRAADTARELGQPTALAESVELLAEALLTDDAVRAAQLLGRAEQLRIEVGAPRTRLQLRRLDRWSPRLRRALGDRYEAAVAEGRQRSVEELLDGTCDR